MTRATRLFFLLSCLASSLPAAAAGPPRARPAALVAAEAGGAVLDQVSPLQAAQGTILTLTGTGFGSLKPKVRLLPVAGGKSRKLKLLSWSDTVVTARIRKAKLGFFVVQIRPRGKGAVPVQGADPVELMPPSMLAVAESCVQPGDEVTLSGNFLGSKTGKLRVAGRKAKVLSWSGEAPEQIVFRVPPKKVQGTVDVEVRNSLAKTVSPAALLVVDSTDLASDGSFGSETFSGDLENPASMLTVSGGQTHVFLAGVSSDSVEFRALYDPALDGPQVLTGLEVLQFSYQDEGLLWVLDFDDQLQSSVTLELDPHCVGLLQVRFSGFLVERFGPGTLSVEGCFLLPLPGP